MFYPIEGLLQESNRGRSAAAKPYNLPAAKGSVDFSGCPATEAKVFMDSVIREGKRF